MKTMKVVRSYSFVLVSDAFEHIAKEEDGVLGQTVPHDAMN